VSPHAPFTSLELCAGGGGSALGLETAGFSPVALVDNDAHACETLLTNRPDWNVIRADVHEFVPQDGENIHGVDLLSAGPPRLRSAASVRRGDSRAGEARAALMAALYCVIPVLPRAVLIENVPNLVRDPQHEELRKEMQAELEHLGYAVHWQVLDAQDFGVPQKREHGVLVALRTDGTHPFRWPEPLSEPPPTVGEVLHESMAARGWPFAAEWAARANRPAPTIVGGSSDHGGADLGPRGTKRTWSTMGVNGATVANDVPDPGSPWNPDGDSKDLPPLTVPQVALLQGFPTSWVFSGGKTSRYRQVGHAFPPPMAAALGRRIADALEHRPDGSSAPTAG
jgi:DNA (cytosine-5)-methyltransferase 1